MMSQKAQQNTSTTYAPTHCDTVAPVAQSMSHHLRPWLTALQDANALLPDNLRFSHLQDDIAHIELTTLEELERLPVFAFTVVVQEQAIADNDLNEVVQTWAKDNVLWQVILVPSSKASSCGATDSEANTQANANKVNDPEGINGINNDINNATNTLLSVDNIEADRLTPVQIYRYILLPTDTATMSEGKKAAAAHMLDDALTSHLKHFINTLPISADMGGDAAIDCHIVSLAHILRPHRIACFDMDSTLIEQEVINALAKEAGVEQSVSAITERAMRGEIDFDTSFTERMALLSGTRIDLLPTIYGSLSLSSGARSTIATLKALGYHTVLVSGGFTYFAAKIAETLGIDEVHANILDSHDELLTGNVSHPIVNKERKAEIMVQIAKRLGVPMSQTVCVGDGANDLAMMAVADIGVAYHAKPIVRARSDAAINATGLEGVLYILGYDASIIDICT